MLDIPLWPPHLPAPCHSILPSSLPDHPSAAGSTRPDPPPTTPLTILTSPSHLINSVQVRHELNGTLLWRFKDVLFSLHAVFSLFHTQALSLILTHTSSQCFAFKFFFLPPALPLKGRRAERDEGLQSVRSLFSSPNLVHTECLLTLSNISASSEVP